MHNVDAHLKLVRTQESSLQWLVGAGEKDAKVKLSR
jgi:hypothetical protein